MIMDLLRAIAAQDEFTHDVEASLQLKQAYALLNNYRRRAIRILKLLGYED